MCELSARGRRPLKQASIPLVPMQVCKRRDWLGAEFTLTDRMMCAGYEHGGVDTCQVYHLLLLSSAFVVRIFTEHIGLYI